MVDVLCLARGQTPGVRAGDNDEKEQTMRLTVIGRVMAVVALAAVLGGVVGAAQGDGGALAVTVEYKGAGTVDKEHRLWLFVFDTPNIGMDAMPIATGTLSENGGTYKFVGLPKQVYLAAAFDEQGGYDMSGPPPQGTPITIHGMVTAGSAAPVATGGDDAKVTITFDDSIRVP
jgi:hypothetical protein